MPGRRGDFSRGTLEYQGAPWGAWPRVRTLGVLECGRDPSLLAFRSPMYFRRMHLFCFLLICLLHCVPSLSRACVSSSGNPLFYLKWVGRLPYRDALYRGDPFVDELRPAFLVPASFLFCFSCGG